MGRIIRVKVNWTGFVGSPGYTNLIFEPTVESDPITQTLVDAAVTKVQTWVSSLRLDLPPAVVTGIDPQVAELDEQTGEIVGFWNATVSAAAPGTSATTTFTSGSGFCISWSTQGVRKGRRVRGRTFVVPIAGNMYEADGSLNNARLTAWKTNADVLAGDANGIRLVIYARTPGAIIPDGGAYDVISSTIKDRPAFLTSRRG